MKFVHVFENVYQKHENEKRMVMIKSNEFDSFIADKMMICSSDEEIKIDWDISLIFAPLCEIKFDGKIRAMEIFMDTNLTCKVK
jgi:hypothetical protein